MHTLSQRFTLSFWIVACHIGLVFFSQQALALSSSEASDNARVITIKAEQLPAIARGRISSFSLAAVTGGRIAPIPFQFDERTTDGYIYMKNIDEKSKKADPLLGQEGFFDANDELIFMLRDAGPRRKSGMSYDGKIISEIEVRTYANEKRYVYLAQEARLESDNYYVRYSTELGRVETDYYALKIDPKNAFMWQEFYYDEFDGANPRKPIDTIKLKMTGRPLSPFSPKLSISNKDILAKVIDEKSGPIRSTTQYTVTLTYLKVPMFNLKLQIIHHEQEISYDSITKIPFLRRRMFSSPELRIALDGYDLYGASVTVKNGPTKPAIVDGEISEIEKEMIQTQLTTGESNWATLETHYGFSLVSNFRVEADKVSDLFVVYADEARKKDKSGYYKGQLPYYGFNIPKLPIKGSLRIIVDLKMFNSDIDIEKSEFIEKINNPVPIKIFNM